MGRIGNAITTWERELNDQDFTSDVFVWAVKNGVVTVEELTRGKAATVATKIRRSGVYEAMFVHQLFFMHLASRGLK